MLCSNLCISAKLIKNILFLHQKSHFWSFYHHFLEMQFKKHMVLVRKLCSMYWYNFHLLTKKIWMINSKVLQSHFTDVYHVSPMLSPSYKTGWINFPRELSDFKVTFESSCLRFLILTLLLRFSFSVFIINWKAISLSSSGDMDNKKTCISFLTLFWL